MHMWGLGGRGGCLYSLLLAWHAKACTYAACQPSAVSVAGGHVICPCCVYVAARPGGSGSDVDTLGGRVACPSSKGGMVVLWASVAVSG